jgi:hypothetical protein
MVEWVHVREHTERPRRVSVSMRVVLELAPGSEVKAIIDDLSNSGFRLRSRSILHVGQAVRMQLPRETIDCGLRWVDGLEAGGVFLQQTPTAR